VPEVGAETIRLSTLQAADGEVQRDRTGLECVEANKRERAAAMVTTIKEC
jgi:hypothetical protein